ncbi:hypothetical protein T265_05778 [Opisthorchis viverrini]|uniref:Uncharacterized protein n=1 Tax=Opisthorchis viverrini TaxID=6198 RepID=A0A074ZJB2_OPIVI|nr:hypothetical protein T265_05778 [Opisthorchis viverrini]KER27076.1 hypothetical protein T265_05778 [Opisthorchis viverrini]
MEEVSLWLGVSPWHGTNRFKYWQPDRKLALLESRTDVTAGPEHNLARRFIRSQVEVSVHADREAWWTQKAKEMGDPERSNPPFFDNLEFCVSEANTLQMNIESAAD